MDIPNDEWDLLYRLRLQAERDLLRRTFGEIPVDGDPLADPAVRGGAGEPVDAAGGRREVPSTPVPAL